MSIFNRFTALVDALGNANHYKTLFSLSDNELAIRGLSRDGLTKSYISGISGR